MLRVHKDKVSIEALVQQHRPETAEANQEGGKSLEKRKSRVRENQSRLIKENAHRGTLTEHSRQKYSRKGRWD